MVENFRASDHFFSFQGRFHISKFPRYTSFEFIRLDVHVVHVKSENGVCFINSGYAVAVHSSQENRYKILPFASWFGMCLCAMHHH